MLISRIFSCRVPHCCPDRTTDPAPVCFDLSFAGLGSAAASLGCGFVSPPGHFAAWKGIVVDTEAPGVRQRRDAGGLNRWCRRRAQKKLKCDKEGVRFDASGFEENLRVRIWQAWDKTRRAEASRRQSGARSPQSTFRNTNALPMPPEFCLDMHRCSALSPRASARTGRRSPGGGTRRLSRREQKPPPLKELGVHDMLKISNNPGLTSMSGFRDAVAPLVRGKNFDFLKFLDLSLNGLTALPADELGHLPHLKVGTASADPLWHYPAH